MELTDSDRKTIAEWVESEWRTRDEAALYRAGLAAGMERAAKICESFGRAHTYASENADHYRGFDAGTAACAKRIREQAKGG